MACAELEPLELLEASHRGGGFSSTTSLWWNLTVGGATGAPPPLPEVSTSSLAEFRRARATAEAERGIDICREASPPRRRTLFSSSMLIAPPRSGSRASNNSSTCALGATKPSRGIALRNSVLETMPG